MHYSTRQEQENSALPPHLTITCWCLAWGTSFSKELELLEALWADAGGCPVLLKTCSSHSWWKLWNWTGFFQGFTLWLIEFKAQFLLSVSQAHWRFGAPARLEFVGAGALSAVPAAPSRRCDPHGVISCGLSSILLELLVAAGNSRCVSKERLAGEYLLDCCRCYEVASSAFHKVFFHSLRTSSTIKLANKALGGATWELLQRLDASKSQLRVAKGKRPIRKR